MVAAALADFASLLFSWAGTDGPGFCARQPRYRRENTVLTKSLYPSELQSLPDICLRLRLDVINQEDVVRASGRGGRSARVHRLKSLAGSTATRYGRPAGSYGRCRVPLARVAPAGNSMTR